MQSCCSATQKNTILLFAVVQTEPDDITLSEMSGAGRQLPCVLTSMGGYKAALKETANQTVLPGDRKEREEGKDREKTAGCSLRRGRTPNVLGSPIGELGDSDEPHQNT